MAITVAYFFILAGSFIYKRNRFISTWSIDEAYMIQQFHNWWSGYPKVTVQPGDLRSGFPGERPFEDNHKKRIFLLYKLAYRAWPQPETLIVVDSILVALSVPALYLFLGQLGLGRAKVLALLAAWLLYPLQQKVAGHSFADPLTMTGTFYFFYLYLLCRDSPFSLAGCLGLFLLREETCFLLPATILILPRKWKTLLWQFGCLVPFVVFAKHGASNPFAYAAVSYNPTFVINFLLTETILWTLALVNAPALFIALGFMIAAIAVGGEIYFQFPYAFLGSSFVPPGSYHYYGLLTAPLMAGVALGIARLKPGQERLAQISLGLLIIPGIAYGACQLRILAQPHDEARRIRSFVAAHVPANAPVVTDLGLPAGFANRDELYVYRMPPKGMTLPEIFDRAKFAFIYRPDSAQMESTILSHSTQHWHRALETTYYVIYQAD